ncbi:MAG: hypothetical protein IT579_10660 [Verrucomicrobia subdivision 3 bacterium]|nr:hypothetical protein [Limisphaerales bacterium]
MTSELSTFAERLRASIASGFPADTFGTLALEVFGLQFAGNAAYRKICAARHITPLTVTHWSQIPAVPTAAFKELELTCLAPAERTHVFHSSGTTEQRPSRHFHNPQSLAVYEASIWEGGGENLRLAGDDWRCLSLTPPLAQAPHSSLVYMFDFVRQKLGAAPGAFVGRSGADGVWTVDPDAALAALTLDDSRPLLVLGTAFAYVHLFEALAASGVRLRLPAGSRVLETGGYKGRSRALPKAELHALISDRLGVPAAHIVCEYGMSELSSQAYDSAGLAIDCGARNGERVFHFPPWARVQIISPETGREVGEGETGLLRVFDLANVFSVLALQTEDLAVRCGSGFKLIGRAQLAEPRGCSLMAVGSNNE